MSKITTIGLYRMNNNLFSGLEIPEVLDRETLINNILRDTGNLEVFYTDADFMEEAIGYWSKARLTSWQNMAVVLFEDYDPFLNIKRDETRTITTERDLQSTGTSSDRVAAWNDTNPVERGNQSATAADTGTITTTEHFHVEGDSAITDAQDVVRNEIGVRTDFNLYDIIKDEFKKEFCVLVY